MARSYYDEYDKKYPGIIIDILKYFDVANNDPTAVKDKSVLGFCSLFKDEDGGLPIQPTIVNRICKRLCDCGHLECIRSSGGLGLYDNYLFILKNREYFESQINQLIYYYNSMVYGFEYVFELYKDIVVPFVWEKPDGSYEAGTGFKYLNGIATAKHCVQDVKNLQIKGYRAKELEGKPIYISENDGVDLAFIETGKIEEPIIYADEGKVMQEVLVMGYPKIPTFTNFLTAEIATISSKASARLTPTKGAIAAYGYEYLARMDAMLITARITGGNSGGPVINQYGCLVGVACQLPDYRPENGGDGDLGYGIAVPVKELTSIVTKKNRVLDIPNDFYRDFND
ncbi:MAG: trypsin-like peptidase domain-containing protein [Oscillospiraceae bacterium]|nr:trypsin-like peptidase domain-containing protein [Oscillospiraceae bacterium]